MVDFSALKNRTNNLTRIQEEAAKVNTRGDFVEDEAYWAPTRGKDGNGFAIVRFLPAPAVDGDDAVPFVKYYRHSFQGPMTDDWYIENCLTSIGKKDPVNDLTRILWKAKTEHDEQLAQRYKRKVTYVSNVLVLKDDANPQAVGKVKKYRYGVKIWAKIEDALNPKIGSPIDPFDLWKGANFGIVIKTVKDYPNYDDSRFDIPSPLSDDDAYLEKVWRESYSLKELLAESNFKDYDTLKEKLDSVVGFSYEERGSAIDSKFAQHTSPPQSQAMLPAGQARMAAQAPLPTSLPQATQSPQSGSTVNEMPPFVTDKNEANEMPLAATSDDDEDLAFLRQMASNG